MANTNKENFITKNLSKPKIIIFGVGGAGGNAINNMIRSSLEGVEFVAANTDAQALKGSLADNIIQLGSETTKGLGAGSSPDCGKKAAEEDLEEISKYIEGANMVFIAAGMGGGTGTGAAPVIAKLAKEKSILTVGVVTKPFHFEGQYRMKTAELGLQELQKYVDTLIVIPNQNLFRVANDKTTFESAFKMADDVLHAGVRGVTDLITMPGLVNLDFADIRTIMTKMGKAVMGTGEASGENRAVEACEEAISNPLLDDVSIKGAKGVLVNMTGGPDMTLFEAEIAVNTIKKEVDENANIIFGSAFSDDMKGTLRISVVATGIDFDESKLQTENKPNLGQKISPANDSSRFRMEGQATSKIESPLQNIQRKDFFDAGDSIKIDELEISDLGDFESESNDLEDTKEEDIIIAKKQVKSVASTEVFPSSRKTETKNSSKDDSGFSLFSFMNSSIEKVDKNNAEKSSIEQESEQKSRSSLSQMIFNKNNNLDSLENDSSADKLSDDFLKDSNSADSKDDILNVPAFFRRKK